MICEPGMKSSMPESVSLYQIGLLVLSLVVIVALVAEALVALPREVSLVIQMFDLTACFLFLMDFCVRFRHAPNKRVFMKTGWIDLVACIPNVDVLRIARLARILRVIQLLRGLRIGHRLLRHVLLKNPQAAGYSIALTTILLVAFASVSILIVESGPDANIHTAEDAIWWSVSTITTVGYGDRFPVSVEGRIIAMVLMISGVGLFGALSGTVASFFIGKEESSAELEEVLSRLRRMEERLAEQRQTVGNLEPRSTSSEAANCRVST